MGHFPFTVATLLHCSIAPLLLPLQMPCIWRDLRYASICFLCSLPHCSIAPPAANALHLAGSPLRFDLLPLLLCSLPHCSIAPPATNATHLAGSPLRFDLLPLLLCSFAPCPIAPLLHCSLFPCLKENLTIHPLLIKAGLIFPVEIETRFIPVEHLPFD